MEASYQKDTLFPHSGGLGPVRNNGAAGNGMVAHRPRSTMKARRPQTRFESGLDTFLDHDHVPYSSNSMSSSDNPNVPTLVFESASGRCDTDMDQITYFR